MIMTYMHTKIIYFIQLLLNQPYIYCAPTIIHIMCYNSTTKEDKNAGVFSTLVRAIKNSHNGTRLGVPAKDIANHGGVEGNLAALWMDHVKDKAGLAIAEIARGLSAVLVQKDAEEVK